MMTHMKAQHARTRVAALCLAAAGALFAPAAADAQDDSAKNDGRLDGYSQKVLIDNDSTALMWLLALFIGVLCLGPMFKDAKRTHLD
jgi:hypothetical protein